MYIPKDPNLSANINRSANFKITQSFSKYVYNLHEIVNKMLDKQSNLTYSDVRERYEHFRSRCTKDDSPKVIKLNITKKRRKKKEKGCTEPLYGKKAKNPYPLNHSF